MMPTARLKPDIPEKTNPTRGRWFPIRFAAEPATGEVLNIGVGFIGEDGRVRLRLLDRFGGLKCLFQDQLSIHDMKFMLRSIRDSWPKTADPSELPASPSPHIFYGELRYAAGESAESITETMYQEVVTLARHREQVEQEIEIAQVSTATARERVFDAMRVRHSLDANKLICEQPLWIVRDSQGREHHLDMPLRSAGRFGTVVSVGYRDKQTRELHLLRAHSGIETGLQIHDQDWAGLFILRPPHAKEEVLRAIDNQIDDIHWKLSFHRRAHLEVEDEEDKLADQIMDWGTAA